MSATAKGTCSSPRGSPWRRSLAFKRLRGDEGGQSNCIQKIRSVTNYQAKAFPDLVGAPRAITLACSDRTACIVHRGSDTPGPIMDVMGRVTGVAVLALLGEGLAGCGISSWLPSATPPASTVQVQSEPAGAEAKSSVGPSCRTPCALTVATSSPFTVTFMLAGHESLTVPVAPRPPGDPREAGEGLKFEPDPVYAQLEPMAPAKGKKRPAAKTGTPESLPPATQK